jgi:hypothetical protein
VYIQDDFGKSVQVSNGPIAWQDHKDLENQLQVVPLYFIDH